MKLIKSKFYTILPIVLSVLVCFVASIMLMSAPKTAFAVEVEYGSGTEGDIYLISSADELYTLSQTDSDWGKNFKLTQDIDLSTVCGANINGESVSWMRIGNDSKPFKGTFDGDDHTISGLYIDSTAGWQGLFGYVENGTIKNLKVNGTVSGSGYVGGIVGYFDVGTVEKCSFEGSVKGGSSNQPVGGIAGYNRNGTIKKCSNKGDISCLNEYAGGIVGQNYGNNAIVSDCENSGTVSLIDSTGKGSTAGGIVGINVGGSKIINCSNTGKIGDVNNQIIGGIVGTNNSSSVTQCYNTGIVTGSNYIGGVAGQNISKDTSITQCYNTGAVSGSQYIGGVAGYNDDSAKIMSCYNTATVTGSSKVGGLVGQNCGGSSKKPTLGTVKHCYNRGIVTGNNSGGVVGLNKLYNSDGTVENCYYLTDTASGGGAAGALVKTQNEFASGEVTWLLQKGQPDYGIQVWGQLLSGTEHEIEKYPVLTDQLPKRVWKASFIKNGETIYVTYVNNSGTITPPTDDDWFESTGARFNSTVQITEDKILGLSVRFGAMTNNLITLDYGQSAEQNLDEWLEYEDGSSTEDKFTYTITDYDGLTGAYIEGNLLKIPSGTNVKEGGYVLQIKAHENNPRVNTTVNTAAFAVSDFGVDDVVFTVRVVVNKINQDPFTIDEIPLGVTYGDIGKTLGTTGGSGNGSVKWRVVSGSDIVDIDSGSGEIIIKRASRTINDVTVSATKSGGDNYYDAFDTVSFTVHKANQSDFSINEIPNGLTYGDEGKSLSTTGGRSGGTVTWSVDKPQLLDIASNGSLTIKGAGTVTVTATIDGGDNYENADDTVTIDIHKAVQYGFSIVVPNGLTYGDEGKSLSTTGGRSGGTVTWSVDKPKLLDIDPNGSLTIKGAGTVTITAIIDGGDNYENADDTVTIDIHKAVQYDFTIVPPSGVTYGDGTFTLSTQGGRKDGTANIVWSIVSGDGYASHLGGGVFGINGAGTVTITAIIDGGDNYENADDTVTVEIHKANQIGFTIIDIPGGVTYKQGGTFTLTTSGGVDGADVTWTVESGSGFASHLIGGEFNILGAGTVTISATKSGNENYESASDSVTLEIHKAQQIGFTIDNIPGGVTYKQGGTFTLTTSGGVDGADVTWTVESGSGFASHSAGGEFNILGAGTVTISATKSGNENYESAFDIITIEIHKAVQYDFTIVAPSGITYGDKDVVLTAKNGLGSGVLTWSVVEGDSYAEIDPVSGALEIKGAGTVVITATKAGDANYESASDTITLEIHKAVQNALSITGLPTGVLTINTELRLGTTGGSSGENVVWSYEGNIELDPNTGVGKILGVGDGTAIITARKPGGDNYYDISTTITLYIDKTNQGALIINVPSGIIYEKDKIITLTCTGGTTNGKVTWSVQSPDSEKVIAVINESTGELTIKGAGTVTVYATMAGNEDYYAATASTVFTINKANQSALTIKTNRDFNGITFGDTGIVFSTDGGSSGGNLTWEVLSGSDIVSIDPNGALTIFHASKSSGDITICATMAGGDNYYDTSATVSFTVNKANQSALIIKAPSGITFGDTGVVFTVDGGSVGGNAIWRVVGGSDIVDIQSSSGALTIKHASLSDNDVTVSATLPGGDDYYDITTYFTFTVKKANQAALTITTNRDFNGITFGDTGIVFSTGGGSINGNVTWQVLSGSDIVDINSSGTLTIKHASKTSGDVTIVATMDGDRDYYAISTSITFTVNKANQPPLTISIGDNLNGITFGDIGVVLSAVGGRAGGTVTWSVLDGADIVSINPSGGALTIKRASRSDNDVTICATVSGGDDYYDTFATITFTVNKANQPALIIDAPNGISYGDNVVLSYSGGRPGGTVVWSVPSGSCTEIDSITGALDILRVGEVTITAFMAGGDNYLDTSATVTFVIKKANQGAFMIKGLPSSVTFGEGTLTLTAEGGSDNGDVEWVVISGNAFVEHIGLGVFAIKGAGDVTIAATKYGGDNYYDTSATVSFTVNKANQEAFRIIDLPNTVVFGDGTFTLKTDGGWEGGTVFWSVVSGIDFVSPEGEGVFKIIGAGEVIISATKTGGNNYYDISTSIRLLIEKATPDVTLPDALTARYGDTLAEVALPQGWTWTDFTLSVGGVGVRGFSAVYTPSDTANYYTVTAVLTITVVKATPVYTLPTALTATYGDTLGDVALSAGWAWNDALTTKVGNAGQRTFTATFTPSDTENYETVTVALTITVQKAVPQFTIPDGLKATVGDTLGDVALPTGWAWKDALTTKVGKAGQRTFTATFTPSDTENYETVTVVLTITVEANGASSFWWWWIVLLIAILIILFIVLLIVRNRKKESKEAAATENTNSQPQTVLQTEGKQQATTQTPAENVPPTIAEAPQTPVTHIEPVGAGVAAVGIQSAPRYKKSFTAHLVQSDDQIKSRYSDIKNELLSYEKIHCRVSWRHETFRYGKKTIAKLIFRGKTLCLYLALNVADYTDKYPIEDAAKKSAKYSATPLLIRLKNNKRMKIAKPLIVEAMQQNGIEPLPECAYVDYTVPYETTEELIEKGFVKRMDKKQ